MLARRCKHEDGEMKKEEWKRWMEHIPGVFFFKDEMLVVSCYLLHRPYLTRYFFAISHLSRLNILAALQITPFN